MGSLESRLDQRKGILGQSVIRDCLDMAGSEFKLFNGLAA